MTDYYRQLINNAAWTWREYKCCRWHWKPRKRKDRQSSRAEKRRARADERADIEDQLRSRLDPLDDYDLCTASCCAVLLPGLGLVRK